MVSYLFFSLQSQEFYLLKQSSKSLHNLFYSEKKIPVDWKFQRRTKKNADFLRLKFFQEKFRKYGVGRVDLRLSLFNESKYAGQCKIDLRVISS